MSNQSQNTGSPSHQGQQPGGGGSQTQHNPNNPKPDRTAQPGQEHRPEKDRPNSDPNRKDGQPGDRPDRGRPS